MTDDAWIDARERKPGHCREVIVAAKGGITFMGMFDGRNDTVTNYETGQTVRWSKVVYWLVLPELPTRDNKAALLEDVFGGEWRKADNGEYECGHFTATVADALVAIGRETARGTLRVTVHVDADQEVRRALEIARAELREMRESVGGLLGHDGPTVSMKCCGLCEQPHTDLAATEVGGRLMTECPVTGGEMEIARMRDGQSEDDRNPRKRLREYLDQLCEGYQEKRWQQCIDGRYHQAVERALSGKELDLLDARDLERMTGISTDRWMMG